MGGDIRAFVEGLRNPNISFTELVTIDKGQVSGIPSGELQHRVYDEMDCVVSAGREGFGIPYLEARRCGCRLILPEYSGHYSMGYNETEVYPTPTLRPEYGNEVYDIQINVPAITRAMFDTVKNQNNPELLDDCEELAWDNQPATSLGEAIIAVFNTGDIRDILIHREVGGLGDVLTMTPALAALHDKYPDRAIKLVVDEKYHAAMTLPYVELSSTLPMPPDLTKYEYINVFQPDPCSRIETKDLHDHGHFVTDRMEAFARALGVSIHNYTNPIIDDSAIVPLNREMFKLHGSIFPVIVQAKAAEEYKSYDNVPLLVRELVSNKYSVYVESDGKLYPVDATATVSKTPLDLNQGEFYGFIMGAGFVIGFDSFLMHICAALSTKFYGIFGPTHPQARISKAIRSKAVHADLDCIGCGRWAGSKCKVTGTLESACMTEEYLTVDAILDATHFKKG